jgi:hypothetical protein
MSKRHKRHWQYMTVKGTEKFPPTKARKQFKLPWGVTGKGLKNTAVQQASNMGRN